MIGQILRQIVLIADMSLRVCGDAAGLNVPQICASAVAVTPGLAVEYNTLGQQYLRRR